MLESINNKNYLSKIENSVKNKLNKLKIPLNMYMKNLSAIYINNVFMHIYVCIWYT